MTSGERWERVRALFDAARAVTPRQREPILREAAEAGMRAELEELLRSHDALASGAHSAFLDVLDPSRTAALLAESADEEPEADELPPGARVGRYSVVRRLGSGGMGVVYLAHDPRLDRAVALKLLSRHLSRDGSASRRFEDEARAASALDHPNIATIYEIGEADGGRVFIAMTYCEGETLRQKLERGPLSVHEAVAIAARIADALGAAHARGIVHRDIKPGNVLIAPDGTVRIVDFGIAKIAGRDLTRSSAALGTVAYMSPEQTRGDAVEPTTDVWSVAVTLYEMLAQRTPFRADNEQALVYAIRNDEPEPIRRVRPDVPLRLAAVLERCLSRHPPDRYADARALLTDLRPFAGTPDAAAVTQAPNRVPVRYAAIAAVAVLVVASAFALRPRQDAVVPAGAHDAVGLNASRLAVLPLSSSSADSADQWFADGLTEELISRLSTLPELRVIARASVMRYGAENRSIARIGRELNVAAVLEGRVRRVGDRVHITVQLTDAVTQEDLWVENYEAELTRVLDVQRDIAMSVAENLDMQIRAADRNPNPDAVGHSAEAYEAYLKGRYFLGKLDEASFRQARDQFQRALDHDPTFAQAWSGLADAFEHLTSLSALSADEAYPRARAAAERALELDPYLADAHASLAMALSMYYHDSQTADAHFRRAIELDPSYARGRRLYASHLRNHGRFEDALTEVRTAQALDPLSAFPRLEEGIIFYMARRYDDAITQYRLLLRAAPGSTHAHLLLALAYVQNEQYSQALTHLERGDPRTKQPDALAIRGYIHAQTGRRADALDVLNALDELASEQPVSAFHKVPIFIALGEHDRALTLLEQAYDERTGLIRLLKVEPMFDPLRDEPRFQRLLEKVGLGDRS